MFSAVIALIGVVVGISGTLFAQRLKGKEKFTEILYKERLTVYKEVFKRLAQIHIVLDQYQQNLIESEPKLHQIKGEAVDLGVAVLDGAGIVSDEVFNDAFNIAGTITNANTLAEILNSAAITTVNARLVQTIRKELGVKALSKEIIAIFEFPSNLLKKPGQRVLKKRGDADKPVHEHEDGGKKGKAEDENFLS